MCIIAICINRKLSENEINASWEKNPHGAGIGWVEDGEVNYIKGLMTLEDFKKEYEKISLLPHIVHFRDASTGMLVNEKLTHPFIIGDISEIPLRYRGLEPVLFHNGTIDRWKQLYESYIKRKGIEIREDELSDTRVIAIIWKEEGKKTYDFVAPGRVTILCPSGDISTYGEWIEKNGIYLSNRQIIDI